MEGDGAKKGDTVYVTGVNFAGLEKVVRCEWYGAENERASSRKAPKSKQNSIGPATSLSSIICWSTFVRGFSTARVCG